MLYQWSIRISFRYLTIGLLDDRLQTETWEEHTLMTICVDISHRKCDVLPIQEKMAWLYLKWMQVVFFHLESMPHCRVCLSTMWSQNMVWLGLDISK